MQYIQCMGLFSKRIEIGSADSSRFESVELMVDTASTYTWIPREIVNRLGLRVSGKRRVRHADGRIVEKEGVDAQVRINGEVHSNFCLIADQGEGLLLGSLTLETFSLGVDPINKTLVPVVASAMAIIIGCELAPKPERYSHLWAPLL